MPGLQRAETQGTTSSRLRAGSQISTADGDDEEESIELPVEPRGRVPSIPPVLTKKADKDPLCWLTFTEDAILTSCKSGKWFFQQPTVIAVLVLTLDKGHLRTWSRPTDNGTS